MTYSKPTSLNDHAGYIAWKNWSAANFGLYTKAEELEFACELQRANINLTPTTKVLEIGFGNGAFAGWVRQFTTHYVGTEANQELVDRARKAGMTAYLATSDITSIASGQPYNIILAFDVLEHLGFEQIIALLNTCRAYISKDGLILLRVPSGDSPFSGTLFNGDITHKTLLGSKAFARLRCSRALKLYRRTTRHFQSLAWASGRPLSVSWSNLQENVQHFLLERHSWAISMQSLQAIWWWY